MNNSDKIIFGSQTKVIFLSFLILASCNNIGERKITKEFERKGDSIRGDFTLSSFNDSIKLFNDLPKPSVVMRYSELNCSVCIDSTVAYVKKLEQDLGIPVTYISSYSNRRDVILFKELNDIKSSVYKTNFISKYDSLNAPYLYVIDDDLVQKSVFIPKKEEMGEYMDYLKYIVKHYFEESLNTYKSK
ncbi:hypothetical protein [Flavivirga rizhaonensis]|uniref:Redoxin domain-containing protein n=1 Tax=Flavivirga rizhaonensis TaxID=2559571 RepID=A0A4S1E0K8_9FLAO|nr:hypothetical protein [Flavivirga rizhaonensis]TGV03438.1 hypothetical protein EM932_07130 [Flavivirga rizhaonensis]